MDEVVKVENLVKRYGDVLALDHFDLTIQEGEVFGLLGPNGSGKTTAINCILQLLTYDKGSISLFGQPMTPTSYQLKRRIGVVPQNVALFDELTVRENIDFFCSLYVPQRARRRQLVEEAIQFVGLEDYRNFRPRKLSGGLLRRLNIACGIAHKPSLVFFDEPTVAVDPQSRNSILEGIRRMNEEGCTVVYTSHYMEEVEEICSRIMIAHGGGGPSKPQLHPRGHSPHERRGLHGGVHQPLHGRGGGDLLANHDHGQGPFGGSGH